MSIPENQRTRFAIRQEIQRRGPITFARFMELALYHPRCGYYTTLDRFGRTGDFLTSPEASPCFGLLICRLLHGMWHSLGRPARFQVVEMGAGAGSLAEAVVRGARLWPGFRRALDYWIIETSPSLRRLQRERLAGVRWTSISKLRPGSIQGCFLSNELVDAFPARRVAVRDGKLEEIYVGLSGVDFVEQEGEPSTPELAAYFARLELMPAEGARVEVNLEAVRWMRRVGEALGRGFVVTIDHGESARQLYSRPEDTLICFHRHGWNERPFDGIGRQDMMTRVDFTTVALVGREHGLDTVRWASQAEMLTELGIESCLAAAGKADASPEQRSFARRAVESLADPAALGRTAVLIQQKGATLKVRTPVTEAAARRMLRLTPPSW